MSQTTHDWEWFIPPIYGDFGDGLFIIVLSFNHIINYNYLTTSYCSPLIAWIWLSPTLRADEWTILQGMNGPSVIRNYS